MSHDRSNWVTKEQLDTPLCDIFEGTKTNGTARQYVKMCETVLKLEPADLESMSYENMNKYIDSLDPLVMSHRVALAIQNVRQK